MPISPFAPDVFPSLASIAGFRAATVATGMRYRNRTDLLLVALPPATTVAGALTRSVTRAAPVDWCRQVLDLGHARGLLVNAGIANAFTGRTGQDAAARMARAGADAIGCTPEEVLIASTGVIGAHLPIAIIATAMPTLTHALQPDGWEAAARAIMTTDTFPKGSTATATIDGRSVRISGIAKGSGMIAPDMATMLAFLFTDAALPAPILQAALSEAVDHSFNCITVDGDTSTSDTVLLFATGGERQTPVTMGMLGGFRAALRAVCTDLARQIVMDGEGAQKFVAVTVTGAADDRAARRIGLSIANSPLVKTAVAGGDANWGRVVMAVGKAGEQANRDRLSIAFGGVVIARDGEGVLDYDEAPVTAHLRERHIEIAVDVGVGSGRATVWTCDLTHGYIDINADYRS